MRRLVALAAAGIAIAVPVGCCTQTCPGDFPLIRQDQLSEQSEDVRQVGDMHPFRGEQDKLDPQLTPVRIHGGIL